MQRPGAVIATALGLALTGGSLGVGRLNTGTVRLEAAYDKAAHAPERYVDRQLGVVCYRRLDSGLACLPIPKTCRPEVR